jgi:hypothetical protein
LLTVQRPNAPSWRRVEAARLVNASGEWSGSERGWESPSVAVEREPVHHQGVAEQVQMLAVVADAVGASEPEGCRRGCG